MQHEKNKPYPITPEYALILLDAPDTKKTLYCLIEFPKSEFHDDNCFEIVMSANSIEELNAQSMEMLCHTLGKYNYLRRAIVDLSEVVNGYDKHDWKYHPRIQKDFCLSVMGISKEQYNDFGGWSWNLVFFDGKEYTLACE